MDTTNNTFPNKEHTNINLSRDIPSLDELKTYIRLKYVDYKQAGISAGISEGRVAQILIGYDLPKTSKLINQIASGWQIDPVKLALLFENSRSVYQDKQELKENVSSK